jgi:hypothetical protein
MKQNRRIKTINRKAMKTRILITALMIAFSTCVIAESNPVKSEDSLYTSSLANFNGIFSAETTGMNVLLSNPSEYMPSSGVFENAANLEEWIESRESWEQESSELPAGNNLTESVDLEGWIESRELWEQENSEMETVNNSMETVNMEEWISSREAWEQESSELKAVGAVYSSSILEQWVTDRETWEQENSGIEWTSESTGTMQEEWISNREAWEQK